MYWHQGIENAPLIIQKCVESVKKYHPDYEIKVLSFDTVKDYVNIPQKYYDLFGQKRIPIAIFSDILRLYLLTTYGGTWIDSTLYFTDRIPEDILKSDFCVMQKDPITDAFGDKMSCYFIHAKKGSLFIHLIRNSIENYWQEQNFVIHYFMFEHIVSMISEVNDELKNKWNNMPFYLTDNLGLLRKVLYEKYDEQKMEEIKQKSWMQKLSYKILKDVETKGTFYNKLFEVDNGN